MPDNGDKIKCADCGAENDECLFEERLVRTGYATMDGDVFPSCDIASAQEESRDIAYRCSTCLKELIFTR